MQVQYYPETIKGIVVALTDMFNDIEVVRRDDNGDISKVIKVPITFGPVNKYQYLRKERESNKEYYLQLPRIALNWTGINYANDRATGTSDERSFHDVGIELSKVESFVTDVMPAPYDLQFELSVRTEYLDDLCQIIENILPYFNPALYLRVKEFHFLNIERNLQVLLDSVSPEMIEEQEENQKREVNAKIAITVKAWMYRPISNHKIIKYIESKYFVSDSILTSAALNLVSKNDTSGVSNLSAAPSSATYDTSGTFTTNIGGIVGEAFYFTSATKGDLS